MNVEDTNLFTCSFSKLAFVATAIISLEFGGCEGFQIGLLISQHARSWLLPSSNDAIAALCTQHAPYTVNRSGCFLDLVRYKSRQEHKFKSLRAGRNSHEHNNEQNCVRLAFASRTRKRNGDAHLFRAATSWLRGCGNASTRIKIEKSTSISRIYLIYVSTVLCSTTVELLDMF
jgi:hypothetical protein